MEVKWEQAAAGVGVISTIFRSSSNMLLLHDLGVDSLGVNEVGV